MERNSAISREASRLAGLNLVAYDVSQRGRHYVEIRRNGNYFLSFAKWDGEAKQALQRMCWNFRNDVNVAKQVQDARDKEEGDRKARFEEAKKDIIDDAMNIGWRERVSVIAPGRR